MGAFTQHARVLDSESFHAKGRNFNAWFTFLSKDSNYKEIGDPMQLLSILLSLYWKSKVDIAPLDSKWRQPCTFKP